MDPMMLSAEEITKSKPASPKLKKIKKKLPRAESLEDLQILSIKKKPPPAKKKKTVKVDNDNENEVEVKSPKKVKKVKKKSILVASSPVTGESSTPDNQPKEIKKKKKNKKEDFIETFSESNI